MPNSNRNQTIWLGSAQNPDSTAISNTDFYSGGGQPGSLGQAFDWNDRAYQRVKLDSGSTSLTPSGAPAANDLTFWKDKATYLVTTDRRFAIGGLTNDGYRNQVAGILRFTPTADQIAAGSHIDILQRGRAISVASDGNGADGGQAVAEAGADGRVTAVTAGTAITVKSIGVIRGAAASNVISVDVDIPNIP